MRPTLLRRHLSALLLPFLAALLLAACGDSDRDETVPALELNPSAEQVTPRSTDNVQLEGKREPNAEITVTTVPDTTGVEILTPTADTWSVQLTNLAAGANTITIAATDDAGNVHQLRMIIVLDQEPPTVTGRVPAADAVGVAIDADAVVTFSEALRDTTVSNTSILLRPVGGAEVAATPVWNPAALQVRLDPEENLVPGTLYEVVLTADLTDLAGNPLAATSWTFTTAP